MRGRPAFWIVSHAYEVHFLTADGREVLGARRTVDRHALVWRGERAFYRLETELSLAEALAVASTLR
ncbi:MAG: hypothetical protein FJZ92_08555 [Chloroflexi bacterium]|nr:hypothetical protein [Chloroflexota bacterium]